MSMSYIFFFNDTATTEIYTLSLHDALPILKRRRKWCVRASAAGAISPRRCPSSCGRARRKGNATFSAGSGSPTRSEEHTSELQSPDHLVCRLLLGKKKTVAPCAPVRYTRRS